VTKLTDIREIADITMKVFCQICWKAKQFREGGESFNEMVVDAIAREVKRRRSLAAHQRIVARSAEVETKTGIQQSSVELIRQLRTNEGRCD
jgi:hypothetical protein